jgi:hypothetical protein
LVSADVPGHFAAAGGMADVDRLLQIERFDERREIVGVGVHVVAIRGLARPAVTAAIVGDASVPARRQKQHLIFPRVGAQGPSVTENNGLPTSPILVVDRRAVFGRQGAHGWSSDYRCRDTNGNDGTE